jgi:uncharacterized membrane protein YqjE
MAHDMSTGAGGAGAPYADEVGVTSATYEGGSTAYEGGTAYAAGQPDVGEVSVGELVSKVTSDLSTLMRQELELAKVEAKEEAKKAGKAAGMFGGAGFAGYMVALFATVAIMAGLAAVMPWGWAALIVTVLWAVVALVLYLRGRAEMKRVQGMPRTKDSLKEDAEWARHPTS